MKSVLTLASASMLTILCQTLYAEIVFGHSIELTTGVNSELDAHKYLLGDVKLSAEQKFDNGFGFKVSGRAKFEHYDHNHEDNETKTHFLIDAMTPIGTLSFGGINKKGASELFYNDLGGMAIDVVRYKDQYNSLRWKGQVGDFQYALSTRNVNNNDHDEISYGIGYSANNWEAGLAYDAAADKQKRAWAASFEYAHKINQIKNTYQVSYIRQLDTDAQSLGFGVESNLGNGFTIGGHYAFNDVKKRENGFGGFVKFKNDDWQAKAKWSHSEKGQDKASIEARYKWAGFAPQGTTFYVGYGYKEDKPKDTGAYAGVTFGLDKAIDLGLAYSQTHESGPLDFLEGTSVFLTMKY